MNYIDEWFIREMDYTKDISERERIRRLAEIAHIARMTYWERLGKRWRQRVKKVLQTLGIRPYTFFG